MHGASKLKTDISISGTEMFWLYQNDGDSVRMSELTCMLLGLYFIETLERKKERKKDE